MKFLLALLVLGSSLAAHAVSLKIEATPMLVGKDNGAFHVSIHGDKVEITESHAREVTVLKIVSAKDTRPTDGPLIVSLSNGDVIEVSSGYNYEGTTPITYIAKDGKSMELIPQLSVQLVK
jgi:hypothetical protein